MSTEPSKAVDFRFYDNEVDRAFVFATWLRNYKYFSYFAKRIKPYVFFKEHHKMLEFLLGKPVVRALVAFPKGDPETICGYLVYEEEKPNSGYEAMADIAPIIHYCYVKACYQKQGVAAALLERAGIDLNGAVFTHWTMPVDELIKKYPDMIYNPYAL